jgi:hypothetical protein
MEGLTMKRCVRMLGLVCALVGNCAWADDECRFQGIAPAPSATVTKCADFFKTLLMNKGKLDASWQSVGIESQEVVTGPNGQEWLVVYKNAVEPDTTKRTLHMIFSLPGNIVAVTFATP